MPLLTRVALGLGLAICTLHGQGQTASDSQVKAAYLYNFAKLANWPKQVLPDGPMDLVICVLGGEDEFIDVLKQTMAGKTIGTHSVRVREVHPDDKLKPCHLVFFRSSERQRYQAALASLKRASVLLVGEDSAFLDLGGMINLVLENGRIRFEVDSDALDRANIGFSSKILALAKADNRSTNVQAQGARQLKLKVSPEYPEMALRMNIKGAVQVEAVVRPDGSVKGVRVIGGHPLLADALTRAVMQWKFEPTAKETVELVRFSFGQ